MGRGAVWLHLAAPRHQICQNGGLFTKLRGTNAGLQSDVSESARRIRIDAWQLRSARWAGCKRSTRHTEDERQASIRSLANGPNHLASPWGIAPWGQESPFLSPREKRGLLAATGLMQCSTHRFSVRKIAPKDFIGKHFLGQFSSTWCQCRCRHTYRARQQALQ